MGGLAAPLFLVYDRLYRNAPVAFLVPEESRTKLRIANVAQETIIVDEITVEPPILQIVRANDQWTVSEDQAATMYPSMPTNRPSGIYIVIKPLKERTIALSWYGEFDTLDENTEITIRCRWRNTRKPLPIMRKLRVKTTIKEVKSLRDVALAGKTCHCAVIAARYASRESAHSSI